MAGGSWNWLTSERLKSSLARTTATKATSRPWRSPGSEFFWRIDGSEGALRTDATLKLGSMKTGEWTTIENAKTEGAWELVDELVAAIHSGEVASSSGQDNLWTLAMMQSVV